MLKSVLKCIESIRILKNGLTFFKIPRANLGGGGRGGLAKLVKNHFFKPFPNQCKMFHNPDLHQFNEEVDHLLLVVVQLLLLHQSIHYLYITNYMDFPMGMEYSMGIPFKISIVYFMPHGKCQVDGGKSKPPHTTPEGHSL